MAFLMFFEIVSVYMIMLFMYAIITLFSIDKLNTA